VSAFTVLNVVLCTELNFPISGTKIDLATQRAAYTQAVLFSIHQAIEDPTPDATDKSLKLCSNYSQTLDSIQNTLFFGNPDMNILPFRAEIDPDHYTLMTANGCVDSSPEDCSDFAGRIFLNGLKGALVRFMDHTLRVCSTLQTLKSYPNNDSLILSLLNDPSVRFVELMALHYLPPALNSSVNYYKEEAQVKAEYLRHNQIILTCIFVFIILGYYQLILQPFLYTIENDISHVRTLLDTIPADILVDLLQLEHESEAKPVITRKMSVMPTSIVQRSSTLRFDVQED
jgi:hypothetical protein